jgi:CrcB protein
MAVALLSVRRRWLAVFYGGFVGTLARYLLSLIIQGWWGKSWPSDILLINLTGAFLLALITTLADGTFLVGPTRRLLLNTGCMGAYTTFSSLALSDVLLWSKGQWGSAALYLVLSLGGGLCAVLLGDWLGQRMIARFRRTTSGLLPTRGGEHVDIQDDLLLPDQTNVQ